MKSKKQTGIDMISGSMWDKILLFALPLAAGSMLQQLFNSVDAAVVGRFASSEALAAVGANHLCGIPVYQFVCRHFRRQQCCHSKLHRKGQARTHTGRCAHNDAAGDMQRFAADGVRHCHCAAAATAAFYTGKCAGLGGYLSACVLSWHAVYHDI